tara:strand:- start:1306 stop:2481 length:1176 start_codon:yes stop_codon:yes gene_type:complete
MRLILWLLALFSAAVAVTLAAKYNTGHALLVIPPYQIELSLNVVAIALIIIFIIFYILIRLASRILGFNQRHRHKKTNDMMLAGLKAYFEGEYVQAEKAASIALELANSSIVKAINAVIAARSAHKLEEVRLRDRYISLMENDAPDEKLLLLITKTELLLSEGHYEAALNALKSLYSTGGLQQTAVLQLELEAQQQAKNWDAVLDLTDILEKRHPANKELIEKLRHVAHMKNIKCKASDLPLLSKYWKDLSPIERMDSKLAIAATHAFIALDDCTTAHKIIEQSIDARWNSELIALYAKGLGSNVNKQIKCAEVWLKSRPNNADLLLTLGKLCTHCELWGKAQNYLEASLSVEPGHDAHLALAQLCEKLGKHEIAMDHYKKGLEFTLRQLN